MKTFYKVILFYLDRIEEFVEIDITSFYKATYFTFSCLWMANFFSICSMGNCGTSYGADNSLVSSGWIPLNCEFARNDGLSLPENKDQK